MCEDAFYPFLPKVIQDLGLSRVGDSLIGDAFVRGLSGGEKRRVSIGCELLTRPGLLLLDEPTTGLDSTNAARVVDILSSLSGQQGVTVLLSIHQPRPDIFRLMDRVMLLSGEGQVGCGEGQVGSGEGQVGSGEGQVGRGGYGNFHEVMGHCTSFTLVVHTYPGRLCTQVRWLLLGHTLRHLVTLPHTPLWPSPTTC